MYAKDNETIQNSAVSHPTKKWAVDFSNILGCQPSRTTKLGTIHFAIHARDANDVQPVSFANAESMVEREYKIVCRIKSRNSSCPI
jgi:nicotinamide mononucleotide (NMN) deamidase PncC